MKESLGGYREIKIYDANKYFRDKFLKLFKREKVGRKISIFSIIPKHLLEVLTIIFFNSDYIFFKREQSKPK